jgi:hypothetical protein
VARLQHDLRDDQIGMIVICDYLEPIWFDPMESPRSFDGMSFGIEYVLVEIDLVSR